MTETEAFKLVGMLAAAFPFRAWPEESMRLYVNQLVDLDAATTRQVVEKIIRTRTEETPPRIAEIRNAVGALNSTAAGIGNLPPDEAWGFVVECFNRVGQYREFPSTHPMVKTVVERMGWKNLCGSEDAMADRARFVQFYQAELERHTVETASRPAAQPIPPERQIEARPEQVALPAPDRETERDVLSRINKQIAAEVAKLPKYVDPELVATIDDPETIARREATKDRLRRQREALADEIEAQRTAATEDAAVRH